MIMQGSYSENREDCLQLKTKHRSSKEIISISNFLVSLLDISVTTRGTIALVSI